MIVAALAIIAFLLAYLRGSDDIWQSTLLNLATELLGVVLVFFLVQYLFRIDELDTNNRINLLLDKLENKEPAKASEFFHPQPEVDELIRKSKLIKVLGVTLTVFIDKGMGAFRDALKSGADVRIILIDGSEESFKSSANRSENNSTSYYEKKHATTLDNLDYLLKYTESLEEGKGNLEIRMVNYPPTVGIEVFDIQNGLPDSGSLKVEIYPQHTGWDKPPIFTVDKKNDPEWFQYFNKQFDSIWNRAGKYPIKKEEE